VIASGAEEKSSRPLLLGAEAVAKAGSKSSSALAEVHVRAALRDDVGTDPPLATTGTAVLGAHA